MNHNEIKEKIFPYLDGELPAASRQDVESHLNTCADCAGVLDNWKRAQALLFAPAPSVHIETFVTRVMASLPAAPRPFIERLKLWWNVPALALAAAVMIFFGPTASDVQPSTEQLLLESETEQGTSVLLREQDESASEIMDLFWEGL